MSDFQHANEFGVIIYPYSRVIQEHANNTWRFTPSRRPPLPLGRRPECAGGGLADASGFGGDSVCDNCGGSGRIDR